MMLRTIAIDDEPLALRQLGSYISRVEQMECVGLYSQIDEAIEALKHEHIDLILCDIEMPEMNGVELISRLPKILNSDVPMVIFTTAYSEYAIRGSGSMLSTTCSNPSHSMILTEQ